MTTVADVRKAMDAAYPPHLAESWDKVGLICGDPTATVNKIMVALEATDRTVEKALNNHADMLVVHHPLLLRGVSSVAADEPKGRLLHQLIRGGCALFAAHTNADAARGGVNDVLAELLGVQDTVPLDPVIDSSLDKWGFTVTPDATPGVKAAIFAAGAGEVGAYSECCFEVPVTGQFRPGEAAVPAIGSRGELETVEEVRVEFVAPRSRRAAIQRALVAAHPYEEPAYDVVEMQIPTDVGIGRAGTLDEEMSLAEFTQRVADRLPETVWGVRAAGDPELRVRRVALCSGAGDSFLSAASKCGADVYVTSDLRHHPADEHLRAGGPALVDTAHWASEFPWCRSVAEKLSAELGVPAEVIEDRTDPWTVSAHPRG